MNLGVRSVHCLKRVGINTLGDFFAKVSGSADLKGIIMDKVFYYQYHQIKPEKRMNYLIEVTKMNNK